MKISIVTPDRVVFEGEADGLTLPGTNGSFQIFDHHAPIISSLGKGILRIHSRSNEQNFEVEGGAVEVNQNKATVLVEAII